MLSSPGTPRIRKYSNQSGGPRSTVGRIKTVYILDSIAVLVFFCAQTAILSSGVETPAQFITRFLLAIALPFIVFNWMVGFVSYLNHTHPDVPWFSRRDEWSFYAGQVNCTVHMGVPPWLVFFVTDLGLHGAHHIDPRIPIWSLDRAEARIVAAARHDIIVERWTFRRHREIMKRCKLYDYDRHRWLDFAGRPTSASVFASPPAPDHPVKPPLASLV